MEERRIRIAITHGDTNGIGYELIFKVFSEPDMLELCTPIIYGSPKVAAYHRKALDLQTGFSIIGHPNDAAEGRLNLLTTFDEEVKVEMGIPSKEAAMAARVALERAVKDCESHHVDAIVTCPVNIQKMKEEDFSFNGQAAYMEHLLGQGHKALNMLVCDELRIAFATSQMPLTEVSRHITKELLVEKVTILADTLKRDFRIANPKIAILALNPTHGEGQFIGEEEREIIAPATETLMANRVNAFGPFAADKFFSDGIYQSFDATLAIYEEQGRISFKLISGADEGTIFTAGIPLVRTAPNIDVEYDAAGKNTANEDSLRQAIYLAIDTVRNRFNHDLPLANPLPKLYRERRDDSEKVRFAVGKRKEDTAV